MSDTLWAPWRLTYILDPKDGPFSGKKDKPCVFCNRRQPRAGLPVAAADREDLVLWRGQHTFTVLNKFPYNNGHLMVMPYEHIGDFTRVPEDVLREWMNEVRRSVALLNELLKPGGFNVGMNLGQVAGAGIPDHVHMHVVPRWGGDCNFMPVIADTRVLPEYIEKTYDQLIGAFRDRR